MNGAHNLGGMMGLGPVVVDPDAPDFRADWERRTFAMAMGMGIARVWSLDEMRYAREARHPADYFGSTYYEIWLSALERLVLAHGLASPEELRAGRAFDPAAPVPRVDVAAVERLVAHGTPYDRPADRPARFQVGDRVVTRNDHPPGHTRLPRYARGRRGVVEAVHGLHVLPDANAHGRGEQPEWLYTVRFSGRELWGESAEPALQVSIAAWESYFEGE